MNIVAVGLATSGPKLLGRATDYVFEGMKSPAGIDFAAISRTLAWVMALYAAAALFTWLQGNTLNRITLFALQMIAIIPDLN